MRERQERKEQGNGLRRCTTLAYRKREDEGERESVCVCACMSVCFLSRLQTLTLSRRTQDQSRSLLLTHCVTVTSACISPSSSSPPSLQHNAAGCLRACVREEGSGKLEWQAMTSGSSEEKESTNLSFTRRRQRGRERRREEEGEKEYIRRIWLVVYASRFLP